MGYITESMNIMHLSQLRSDLEYKVGLIHEAKRDLLKNIADLTQTGANFDSDSEVVKNLKARKEVLKAMEAELDHQLQEYQSKIKFIDEQIAYSQNKQEEGLKRIFGSGR